MIPTIRLAFENAVPQSTQRDLSDCPVARDWTSSQPNATSENLLHLADLITWAYNPLDAKTVSIIKEKLKNRGGESLTTIQGNRYMRGWIFESLILLPLGCLVVSTLPMVVAVEIGLLFLALEQSFFHIMPMLAGQFSAATQAMYILYICCGFSAVGLLVGIVSSVTIAMFPRFRSPGAFCYFDTLENKTIIFFRGSTPWWYNCTINALLGGRWRATSRHLGFQRAWELLQDDVRAWLDRQDPARSRRVILTGHSLGGAIAQIAAYELADEYAIEHVTSFGSAMIGGPAFRDIYNSKVVTGHPNRGTLLDRTRHYTFGTDSMPRMPVLMGFAHVGRRYNIASDGIIRNHVTPRDRFASARPLVRHIVAAILSGPCYVDICTNFRQHCMPGYRKALQRRTVLTMPRQ
jgi:pimeloyl-ACP methyl ester carboxylesterase